MIILEILNCLVIISSVYFLSKNNKIGWLLSILGCISMCIIYNNNNLIYLSLLQIVFIIQSILAYYDIERFNKYLSSNWLIIFYTCISLLLLSTKQTSNILSIIDILLVYISLLANHLMMNKKYISWYLWILYDIISIILCLYLKMYMVLTMFIILMCISVITVIKIENEKI